jgi:hypothetical protein
MTPAQLRVMLNLVQDTKTSGLGSHDQTQSAMGRPFDDLEVGACA